MTDQPTIPAHLRPGTHAFADAVYALTGRFVEVTETDDDRDPRVLHLGIVATVPGATAPTSGYGVCLGYADVTIYPGEDSYRNWGNTEDPDEDHTDDGTRHIVIDWTDDPVADEDETARAIMDRYAHYLADAGLPWRVADYAVWSDEAHSENQRLVTR